MDLIFGALFTACALIGFGWIVSKIIQAAKNGTKSCTPLKDEPYTYQLIYRNLPSEHYKKCVRSNKAPAKNKDIEQKLKEQWNKAAQVAGKSKTPKNKISNKNSSASTNTYTPDPIPYVSDTTSHTSYDTSCHSSYDSGGGHCGSGDFSGGGGDCGGGGSSGDF